MIAAMFGSRRFGAKEEKATDVLEIRGPRSILKAIL
jgi:hypothetical protein